MKLINNISILHDTGITIIYRYEMNFFGAISEEVLVEYPESVLN